MTTAGWFGKLSGLGDFASRRLPPEWVHTCDQWLSACMDASQRQLGERWMQAYLGAPVWRFAWAPQVVDAQWWFGVLMPSCDKVGRYFPLVVAHGRPAPPVDRFAIDHLELWWARAAQAALETLAEGADVAQFETALEQLPSWPGARPSALPSPLSQGDGALLLPAGSTLQDLVQGQAAAQLLAALQGQSCWLPWRPDGAGSTCLLVPGLPVPARFAQWLGPAD